MTDDYLWDRSGEPDREIQKLEETLGRLRYRPRPKRRPIIMRVIPYAAAASLVLAVIAWWATTRTPSAPVWTADRVSGNPTIDGERFTDIQRLTAGRWLETDSSSAAHLYLDGMGEIEVRANSRVRLIEKSASAPRLELAKGTIYASTLRGSEELTVETPSAEVLDGGSAFTLTTDESGAGVVCVTSGSIALLSKGRRATIPEGGACQTRPGIGPGTPYCESASDQFLDALDVYDFGNEESALSAVLTRAGPCDLMALWHLLGRVGKDNRARVYDRMIAVGAPPRGTTREGILALDKPMMDNWWYEISEHQSCLLCSETPNQESGDTGAAPEES